MPPLRPQDIGTGEAKFFHVRTKAGSGQVDCPKGQEATADPSQLNELVVTALDAAHAGQPMDAAPVAENGQRYPE